MKIPILISEIEPLIYRDEKRNRKIRKGLFLCYCDNQFEAKIESINSGRTKSCGCVFKKGMHRTHGESKTPVYNSWLAMKSRCYNKNNADYKDYGGRGITVCERWKNSFEAFLEDMSKKPGKEYSIERKDVNGNYEPDNCKWATGIEQANNRRNNNKITYKGQTKTLAQWEKVTGISQDILGLRVLRGWDLESIFNIRPKMGNNQLTR